MKGKSLSRPTHVITASGQWYGKSGWISKGEVNQVKVYFYIPELKQTVFIRRNALLTLNPCLCHEKYEKVAEIVSNAAKQDTLNVLHRLREDHEKKLAYTKQYQSDYAKGHIDALEWSIQSLIVEETRL